MLHLNEDNQDGFGLHDAGTEGSEPVILRYGKLISTIPEGERIPAWHGLVRYDQGRNRMIGAFIPLAIVLRFLWAIHVWLKVGNSTVPVEPRESWLDGYETGRREEFENGPEEQRQLVEASQRNFALAEEGIRAMGQYRIGKNVCREALNAIDAWHKYEAHVPFPRARLERALQVMAAIEINDGSSITRAMQTVYAPASVSSHIPAHVADTIYGRFYGQNWVYDGEAMKDHVPPKASSLTASEAMAAQHPIYASGDDIVKSDRPLFDRGPEASERCEPPIAHAVLDGASLTTEIAAPADCSSSDASAPPSAD